MSTVQVLVQKDAYAGALSTLLNREGKFDVVRLAEPDFECGGVIVADGQALERFPSLLQCSGRLVMIAPNDPKVLSELWEHDIRSVVFDTDPPSTAVLAILGADINQSSEPAIGRPKAPIIVINSRAASPRVAQISPQSAV